MESFAYLFFALRSEETWTAHTVQRERQSYDWDLGPIPFIGRLILYNKRERGRATVFSSWCLGTVTASALGARPRKRKADSTKHSGPMASVPFTIADAYLTPVSERETNPLFKKSLTEPR